MSDLAWGVFAAAWIIGLPTFFGYYSYVIRTRKMAGKCKINLGLSIDKIASQLRKNNIEPETHFSFTSDMGCSPGSALCSRSSYTITANNRSVILGCYTKAPETVSVNAYSKTSNSEPPRGLKGFKSQGRLPHTLPEDVINKAIEFLSNTDLNTDDLPNENDFDGTDKIDVDIIEAMEILKGTDLEPESHSQKIRAINKTLR